MAQKKITITVDESTSADGMIYSQEFADQMTGVQKGDRFWIPGSDLLVVFGTEVGAGTPNRRAAAERMFVVRLDKDNNPTEVSQLFVSQLAKKDGKTSKYVFTNELAEAHRLGMKYFKKQIAEKILEAGNNKSYNARIWNKTAWKKEDDGSYATETKDNAFNFGITTDTLSGDALDKAVDLLVELYKTIPNINVEIEE